MQPGHDAYPSRTRDKLAMFPRRDPIVHGREPGPLTSRQLADFERDGYLYFPGFFDSAEIAACGAELARLSADPALRAEDGVITEPGSEQIRTLFAVHRRSEHFARLAADPRLLSRARQLLGGRVYIHQSRINYKPGFTGKGFNWHSDFETWHAEDGMPRMRAVSCSIILTENTPFNGPLMLIPGSHRYFVPCVGETPEEHFRASLKDQQVGVPDTSSLTELIAAGGGIHAPTGPAGSLILFECNTLHGSNANMSPDPRSNVFFVYNAVENRCRAPFQARAPRPRFLAERQPVAL